MRMWILGVILSLVQVFTFGSCEEVKPCTSGFSEELYFLKADQKYLDTGRWNDVPSRAFLYCLGQNPVQTYNPVLDTWLEVLYDDCSGRQRFLFNAADSRFKVESDGTVLIKRPVTLHEGHKSFFVHAWDSVGKKVTARVRVQLEPQTSHVLLGVENVPAEQSDDGESVPVLVFPWSSAGLKRRKREWVIPPITILEGQMGPFPKEVMKPSMYREIKMQYWITGPGADEPPRNIFIMDRNSGQLYVTQPLDREKVPSYILLAHASAVGSSFTKEEPIEVLIAVSDQNDNKPVFSQDVYMGSVPEAMATDYEILSVTATDADDPDTSNAALRYSIIGQDPPLPVPDMFAINPTSGQIRLNNAGLDKKKYPQYTLTVQVGDMMGEGYLVTCKAIITVTDSNDNAPQFDPQSYEVSVAENQKDIEVMRLSVNDADDPETPAWFTKFKIIQGNDGNVFNVSTAPGGLDGVVATIRELDFEKKNKYTLLVTVENEALFAFRLPTATATVVVNVLDVNEALLLNSHAPQFPWSSYSVSVPEHRKDVEVVRMFVYDNDEPMTPSWLPKFEFVQGNDEGYFNVSTGPCYVDGIIKTVKGLDYEKKSQYTLLVTVENEAPFSTQLPTATATVVVNVEDEDEAPAV